MKLFEKNDVKKLLKDHPVCKPINSLDRTNDGLIWLNPNNQKCFNFGWFDYNDFVDWTNGTGKIVKGETDEEKQKFWEVAKFESEHEFGWAIGYNKKYFDLINHEYKPNYNGNSFSREIENPLKITSKNHKEIIANIFGYICHYYIDIKLTYDSHANKAFDSELIGAKQALFILGVGYYGACNTPCEPENLNWIADIAKYKAAYLYFLNNNVQLPDFDFVYGYKD